MVVDPHRPSLNERVSFHRERKRDMGLPLITNRLRIERFGERHLNDSRYLAWLSDRENLVSLNLIDYLLNPVTQEKLARYYESFRDSKANRLFAICLKDEDRFVGTATLREIGYGGLFDLGILVGDKAVRGRGIATEVIGALRTYAFGELEARKICSSFADDNIGVLLAFLRNGFRVEGLQREQQMGLDGKVSNRYIVGLIRGDLK
jgi:RimJ/RimL family protein N-acetyltransferase